MKEVKDAESQELKRKCEKCLAEWEQDKPETYENCPLKASKECPVSQAIALRSFS
jgi:hypothetical protein